MRYLIILSFITACSVPEKELSIGFQEVSERIGISFNNRLEFTEEFNPYTYRNFFNGGGVALGDINNDGYLDIYLTGNQVDNKLYLNKGNWIFEDITEKAGVACSGVWSSGATFADINQDGFVDLYVCKAGRPSEKPNRRNELFINNGDNTFTEKGKEYGLDIKGLSVHAAFFDYDMDGDLDAYVLNNSMRSVGGYDLIKDQRLRRSRDSNGNKFLRNENGKYVDYSEEAGIYSSEIGFGLGITLGDFNEDKWPDIFISNDFFERDYLYINNQRGGFTEDLENQMQSISMGSMGADAADINNDLKLDVMVTEMLPESIERRRTKQIYEDWDKYSLGIEQGYHYQLPRNVLQMKTDEGFLEVGRFADVAASDWSWGALIFDLNNDGLRDIFISNGIKNDLLDRDYLTYVANGQNISSMINESKQPILDLIDLMPSTPVENSAFVNMGGFKFENKASELGLGMKTFSNGSAYGDLDNDGDLDLVVNNINMPASVFENKNSNETNRGIQFSLKNKNGSDAIGAEIIIYFEGNKSIGSVFPSRGFQSSVDPRVHFGVGSTLKIDSAVITWPSLGVSTHYEMETNKIHTLVEPDDLPRRTQPGPEKKRLMSESELKIGKKHNENIFIDFNKERLLPFMYSKEGPALAVGDLNGDGLDDVFIGGAKGDSAGIFMQNEAGFERVSQDWLGPDAKFEDVDAEFFDFDNDGDLDLVVASGGRANSSLGFLLYDRIYKNDGFGTFSKFQEIQHPTLTGAITSGDYDQDGKMDLFVGERMSRNFYSPAAHGKLYEFDEVGLKLTNPGDIPINMVTDAASMDMNGDGWDDLIISNEWGTISLFMNESGQFVDKTSEYGLDKYHGLWNELEVFDLEGDGDLDIAVGNHGLNNFFKKGLRVYVNDFDRNGFVEQVFCHKLNDRFYPIADKDELIKQLPGLKKRILYFSDYAAMAIDDLFEPELLNESVVMDADELRSGVFVNNKTRFEFKAFPMLSQLAPIYALKSQDVNNDGLKDLILGGNQYSVKPQFGRYDATQGIVLLNRSSQKEMKFDEVIIGVQGEIRGIETIKGRNKTFVVFARNNDFPILMELNEKTSQYE